MRGEKADSEHPMDLERCRERFEDWRRTRERRRIPERLWQAAVRQARQHGATVTARALRLNGHALRVRLRADEARRGPSPASMPSAPPGFIEVPPLASAASGALRYVVELGVAERIRLRVEVHVAGALDVESLARIIVREFACSK